MKKTMLEIAKNPESVKIDNVEAIISNDSLCVLSCIVGGQNSFGGYTKTKCWYYFIKYRVGGTIMSDEYLEYEKNNILQKAKEYMNSDSFFYPIISKYENPKDQYNVAVFNFVKVNAAVHEALSTE